MGNSKREKTKRKFDKRFWLFLILIVLYIGYQLYQYQQAHQSIPAPDGALHVHMIECGQGDAFLFECNGLYGLIDCGPNSSEDKVLNYLENQNVNKLQFIVGTHPHEDHMGEMYQVLEKYEVDTIYLPEYDESKIKTRWHRNLMTQIEQKKINVVHPECGQTFYLDDAIFKVVGQLSPEEAGKDYNNYSTVIKVSFGEMDILMTGDAEKSVEKAMLSSSENLECEVLKLGHHGSDSSTTQVFLDVVNPTYALVSCEVGNSYHHPCLETMKKLEEKQVELYRTDEIGDVELSISDNHIAFNKSPGDYIDGDSLAKKRGFFNDEEKLYGD